MRLKRATQAFLWKLNTSNFKAAYGRFPESSGDTSYSKNYLQVRSEVRDELNKVLGHSGIAGNEVEVNWVWPSGRQANRYDNKDSGGDNRGQLYITKKVAPNKEILPPFAPGDVNDPLTALDGNAFLANPVDATTLMNAIIGSGIGAWFMAVALEGETGVLHARMVLESPPPGKEMFGLDRQPKQIREAIASAGGSSSLAVTLEFRAKAASVLSAIEDALERSPNVLLVGPPGCGKSVALEDLKAAYEEATWFDPDEINPWTIGNQKVFDTAFYPGLSYENFVAGLAPAPGRGIRLEVRSGPLVNMAQWCRGSDRRGLLIIDEFNRGPAAAIFGDMLVLLDKGKREGRGQAGVSISQPYPDRTINVPAEFASVGSDGRRVPQRFTLPANLRLIGAFNSSDRSVAPLDAALLRRFALVRVEPDPQVLAKHLGLFDFDPADLNYQAQSISSWGADDVRRLTVHLLMVLNGRLRAILGEDHQLGHALFWEVPADAEREETARVLAGEFEEKVIGRLRITLRDKDEQLAVILNAPEPGEPSATSVAEWSDDDSRVGRLVGARLRIRNLKEDLFDDQIKRLLTVVCPDP
jgi:5-methylcytosine-specific restriction protein B